MSDIQTKKAPHPMLAKWKKYRFLILAALVALAAIVTIFFPNLASAYVTPAAADPGYNFYDLVLTKGLQGPIGFVGALWLLIDAGTTIGTNPKIAVLKAIGGGALIQADKIANSLGYIAPQEVIDFTQLISYIG